MCKRTVDPIDRVVSVLLQLCTEYRRRIENAFYVYHLSFPIRIFGYYIEIVTFSVLMPIFGIGFCLFCVKSDKK